jgi:hypothetical protein
MQNIAEAKRKENIIEYLLYLWQMEDLLRSVDLDTEELNRSLLAGIEEDAVRQKNLAWFVLLAHDLKSNKAEVSGHSSGTYDIIAELTVLQHTLLTVIGDEHFKALYAKTTPLLNEFRAKSDKLPKSDVETALTAMYGCLTLRLAGKQISPETEAAFKVFGAYLKHLAKSYRDMKSGQLPLQN